tara:strand:+ start:465 stop:782 length:318 start_codon:yes stop_codon:yes gene_type:complete
MKTEQILRDAKARVMTKHVELTTAVMMMNSYRMRYQRSKDALGDANKWKMGKTAIGRALGRCSASRNALRNQIKIVEWHMYEKGKLKQEFADVRMKYVRRGRQAA